MAKFYLKDWHGKEQEFEQDKIFVRGEDGELIQFTQGEGAVVQPLEVTENGTYTAPDGVDGYSPVTVNVKGDGGGLPAGVYWEALPWEMPNGCGYRTVELNGEIYAFSTRSANQYETDVYYIHKLVNGAWETILDNTYFMSFNAFNKGNDLVYKGEIHTFYSTAHRTFDGNTIKIMSNLPSAVSANNVFVQDGVLKVCSDDTEPIVYVYDETSDSWTTEATLPKYFGPRAFFMIDGICYVMKAYPNEIHTYSNGTLTKVADLAIPRSIYSTTEYNGKIYISDGGNNKYPTTLYRYDPKTSETSVVGYVPSAHTDYLLVFTTYQNKLAINPYRTEVHKPTIIMREVTE